MNQLKIATRKSPLALAQAHTVGDQIKKIHPNLQIKYIEFTTQGDVLLDSSLDKFGGKGLFVKELQRALLDQEADIAVHSMKDVPVHLPDSLEIAVIPEREEPSDAFCSKKYDSLDALPLGANVGTSSLRRTAQLRSYRPDLQVSLLRGNVGTRLAKMHQYDGIILATSGLARLDLTHVICEQISKQICLPAPGQGALGIECRKHDDVTQTILKPLQDQKIWMCVMAERSFNQALGGGCHTPVAANAEIIDGQLLLKGWVGEPSGHHVIQDEIQVPCEHFIMGGVDLAARMISKGARSILSSI